MITGRTHGRSHSPEWLFCFLVVLLLLGGCTRPSTGITLSGATMGTTWHVTYLPGERAVPSEQVQETLETLLLAINDSMSTWQSDSEISRFNRSAVGAWVAVSPHFARVTEEALRIGKLSGGAYDVTVGPLVELWGFGPVQPRMALPDQAAIDAAGSRVGQAFLEFDVELQRMRRLRDIELDFSSIAKGYAVDILADALSELEISNYLVEIGGEMRVAGSSPRGDAWRVAIERPEPGTQSVALGVALSDMAVATSGDYRNYFEVEGQRFSHSIDPRTGYPVAHDLVSVTVLAESCMTADGWATALTVLGADAALALAEAQGLAVYLMRRDGERIVPVYSSAFEPWLDTGSSTQ
mgnify:FL=1